MQQIFITGRIGRSAETRRTQSGVSATSFRLASSYKVKGEERTDWFDCTVFDERGEKLAPYLVKGTSIAITGQVSARAFMHNAEARASIQVNVDKLDFMSSGKQEQQSSASEYRKASGGHAPASSLDDEIPF